MSEWQEPGSFSQEMTDLLRELVEEHRMTLGEQLFAVHVFGSLVAGDFDSEISDLDLLVTTASDISDSQVSALREKHDAFGQRNPAWRDRIDASYLSIDALRMCMERESDLVVISRGEPLHRTRTSPGWRMNWYAVREHGLTLLGPPAATFIASMGLEDYVAAVRIHLRELPRRADAAKDPADLAYLVLTACRGLLTCTEGRSASKRGAAACAAARNPDWAPVIERASARRERRERGAFPEDAQHQARAFVHQAVAEALREDGVDPSW